ncbi:glycosyltransferase family 4 protein [Clostridium sp. AF19-22AC]|jgi:1,2-diacylglycerol 3-alpha-glucosyltransferase|uniref:glycosyltransferase n=1 Tax=Clostridia TaxID=186801 RepID=UPI000E4F309D|nr:MULTISPECIES: glycosyltransferase [Clostridia]RHR25073.1 glycosyltransferase family 4 protein [Clostridium sp. AF19-22AC]
MRIAMLTNNYKPFVGGVPISVERQAKELVKLGHQVMVFAPEYKELPQDCDEYSEEHVIRYRTSRRKMDNGMVYPRMISREILEAFETEKFDCIHVHHPMYVGPMALYLGKRYNLPVIYTYHTKYEDYLHYIRLFENVEERSAARQNVYRFGKEKLVPGYMKWFTNQCDLILAPTASMQEAMRKGGTKTPTAVFPTGLEDSFYIKDEEKSAELREKYLQGRKHLFCSVSRLEAEKNPKFLLRGIARLKERMDESFRLLLIGEGSMRDELEEMAAELGISEEVVFVGNVENTEMKHYLNACELFLFASKSETQGIVLAEAFAAGNPVVAVKATGVEDIVADGKNGYMTNEDIEEWTGKVLEALNEERYQKLKQQAEITAAGFRSSSLAVYEELLYTQCINQRKEEGREYENETNWAGNLSASIYRLFKAS